jgi:hypothetical protein
MNTIVDRAAQRNLSSPWLSLFLVSAASLGTLYAAIFNGIVDPVLGITIRGLWLVVAILWLVLLFRLGHSIPRRRSQAARNPMNWMMIVLPPLLASVTILLINLQMPLRVAFAVSRPSMNQLAQQVLQSNPSRFSDRRVGIFKAQEIKQVEDGIQFKASDMCFITGCTNSFGFAYFSGGQLPASVLQKRSLSTPAETKYTRINGKWFWWMKESEDF